MMAAEIITSTHTRSSTSLTARYTLISIAGIFGTACIGQLLYILIQNRFFLHGLPRAQVVEKSNIMRITLNVPTTLEVYPGQHINLCMPGASLLSLFQSHPFVIVSAQCCENRTILELVVEARRGWTSRLHSHIGNHSYSGHQSSEETSSYLCLFSGPHGYRRSVDKYGVVFLVASGWGVIGLLPYLQDLIRGYNSCSTKARRIHLIWQLQDAGQS